LGLWGLLIFLFVGLHKCGSFNLVNFQTPITMWAGAKTSRPHDIDTSTSLQRGAIPIDRSYNL